MGPWGWEAQKSLDTVTIPQDHVTGCNCLHWTGRNSVDESYVVLVLASLVKSTFTGVVLTKSKLLRWEWSVAIVKGYSWGLFDVLFLLGYNWTFNNISLSIRSHVTLEISVYTPLSKQFVCCWSSHVLLKIYYQCVSGCACMWKSEDNSTLYVISNLFPSLYGSIWRSNSNVHGNGQPRLQVLKGRFVNCLYFGNYFLF